MASTTDNNYSLDNETMQSAKETLSRIDRSQKNTQLVVRISYFLIFVTVAVVAIGAIIHSR